VTAQIAPAVTRGRPRDLELRDLVLSSAARQLETVGFAAMTMEGIVADTGVAKRTLYRWWPSKASVVGEAILAGFIPVPDNQIERTEDLWADLSVWLHQAAISVRGPYGEVLRAATAISAADATLGDSMSAGFAAPARSNLLERFRIGVADGQLLEEADFEAVVDVLMAMVLFIGVNRQDTGRIEAVLSIIRSGISA
jgi:AcrR family transcriptional regulator